MNWCDKGGAPQSTGSGHHQRSPIEESIGVPDSLTSFITRQIEDLSNDEQRILETASVVGVEFPSALVAAVLAEDTETIETHCDTLMRQGRFLQSAGPSEQPDGTIAARYRFVHAFYRDVLYNRLGVNQRVRLHEHIGRQ
jgi:predicted ATPase